MLGISEITLILIAILLLFGGKRIPELAKALGRATYEYKKAKDVIKKEVNEIKEEIEKNEEKPKEYELTGDVNNPDV